MYDPKLNTFLLVVDAGSFRKAAEELHTTSPAVIRQINRLESDLGVKLFFRSRRSISLTSAGKSLYIDARHIVHFYQESVIRARIAVQGDRVG